MANKRFLICSFVRQAAQMEQKKNAVQIQNRSTEYSQTFSFSILYILICALTSDENDRKDMVCLKEMVKKIDEKSKMCANLFKVFPFSSFTS